jgi:lipoprotein-anchoring transpeptidase ErfK/SrfK
MDSRNKKAQEALNKAKQALRDGDKLNARRWAEKAAAWSPQREEPWLVLAAVASPRASIAYLDRALKINPNSQRARQGMHWAIQRYRAGQPVIKTSPQISLTEITPASLARSEPALLPWAFLFIILFIGFNIWLGKPFLSAAPSPLNAVSFSNPGLVKATLTHTPTFTLTPSKTPTTTPTPTATTTLSLTPSLTATPEPTETARPVQDQGNQGTSVKLPPGVERGERWIDIDLSNQRIYAYQGKNLLNSFIVSTGTWQHPTVTGQYRIYVKYLYADMAGPGYYLPNVPYVMYFYKGYGIHGTYWHNNFGTPMSHGCVNLRTDDAGWVYNWSSIGTLVNIHY